MNRPRCVLSLAVLAILLSGAVPCGAQSGTTLTPDRLSYLVSADVFGARWTISLNVAPGDESTIVNMTGNILRDDGSSVFVHCLPRVGSTQFTREPGTLLVFDCQTMGACADDATGCSRFEWQILTGPGGFAPCASFFLPGAAPCPGAASVSGASSTSRGAIASGGDLLPSASRGGETLEEALAALAAPLSGGTVQADDPGTARTLTADGFNHLVSFDFFGARWSVSLNFFPVVGASGALEKALGGMTGNLFYPDGRAPRFVYCGVREDSNGRLDEPRSIFRFDCDTASPCAADPVACAQVDWTLLATDFRFAADNFLPPEGLGAPLGSDPGLVVLPPAGSPGSPGGIGAPADAANSSAAPSFGGIAGSNDDCPVGARCGMRIGGCGSVSGRIEELPQCSCTVRTIPENCIECGRGALGNPGGECSFGVTSELTARGVCLPTSYLGNVTACFPIGFEEEATIPRCGGPVGAGCPRGTCCADDPRDGCVPSETNGSCAGICVDTLDCNPEQRQCGICTPFLSGGPQSLAASGGGEIAYAAPIDEATICGNGVRDHGEECDGGDLSGASCESLGFAGGSLACADDCGSVDSSGCVPF